MAGLTWWNDIPSVSMPGSQADAGELSLALKVPRRSPCLKRATSWATTYINHDGWKGKLQLIATYDTPGQPNITGSYIDANGFSHLLRAFVRTSTYYLPPDWGPDHKIVMFIDLPNTPTNPDDDQLFEGYLFTQTKDAIAGLTYWHDRPFGFYAVKPISVYLPTVRK